ncbi:MAG: hypothetical protein QM654_16460 [Dysgonamonadaceae bacterium]
MKTSLCAQVEYILHENVDFVSGNKITPRPFKKLVSLILEDIAIYTAQSSNPDAGLLITETLKIKIKESDASEIMSLANKYFILLCHTSNGTFIFGTLDYPATLSFSSDKQVVTLTFSSVNSN